MGRTNRFDPDDVFDDADLEYVAENVSDKGYCDFCEASHSNPNNQTCRKSLKLLLIGNDITAQGLTSELVQEVFDVVEDESEAA